MRAQDWRNDPAPYVPGAKHHSLVNEDYWAAMRRAEYFRWAAGKPFVGRDPLTGREERSEVHREAERRSNAVQARVWLTEARRLRERFAPVLPDAAGALPVGA